MSSSQEFAALLERLRNKDQAAAQELVRRFGPVLQRTLALRLQNSSLRRVVDAEDVCQSVFKSFFVRAALGQYELAGQDDLVNLLMRMAHNKLSEQQRREHAERRDARRNEGEVNDLAAAAGPTPSAQLSAEELLHEARRRMSEEERQILSLREQGLDWLAVATQIGGTAEGRRKQWDRARERVAKELGLEE